MGDAILLLMSLQQRLPELWPSIIWFIPKWPQEPGFIQAETRTQELHPGWQSLKYLVHLLLVQKWRVWDLNCHSKRGSWHHKGWLNPSYHKICWKTFQSIRSLQSQKGLSRGVSCYMNYVHPHMILFYTLKMVCSGYLRAEETWSQRDYVIPNALSTLQYGTGWFLTHLSHWARCRDRLRGSKAWHKHSLLLW